MQITPQVVHGSAPTAKAQHHKLKNFKHSLMLLVHSKFAYARHALTALHFVAHQRVAQHLPNMMNATTTNESCAPPSQRAAVSRAQAADSTVPHNTACTASNKPGTCLSAAATCVGDATAATCPTCSRMQVLEFAFYCNAAVNANALGLWQRQQQQQCPSLVALPCHMTHP